MIWCHGNDESLRVREIVEHTGFPPVFMGMVTVYRYHYGPRGGLYRSKGEHGMLGNPKMYCRVDLGDELPFPEPTWCEKCGFVFTGGWHEYDHPELEQEFWEQWEKEHGED